MKKKKILLFNKTYRGRKKLATSYAKLNSLSLGEAFKKALFEKIEEECDIVIAEEAFKKYIDSGKKSRPFSELKKELELWYIPQTQHQNLVKNLRN